jgi:hypothetical protein
LVGNFLTTCAKQVTLVEMLCLWFNSCTQVPCYILNLLCFLIILGASLYMVKYTSFLLLCTYKGKKRRIQDFCRETWGKATTWKAQA